MNSMTRGIPSLRRVYTTLNLTKAVTLPHSICTGTESRTEKLERIADELIDLTKIERHDYAILYRLKMGYDRYGPAVSGPAPSAPVASGSETKAAEKTEFDVKLEKYSQADKMKTVKEVKAFTGLGLKESKDLVEKAPVVIKTGVKKEEADKIVEKLKELGATVVLE